MSSPGWTGRSSNHRPRILDCPVKPGNDNRRVKFIGMPPNRSNVYLLYTARCLRGFGDGFAVIILPAYLSAIGLGPIEIGLVATASLLGTAVFTLLIGLIAPRAELRHIGRLGAAPIWLAGPAFPH